MREAREEPSRGKASQGTQPEEREQRQAQRHRRRGIERTSSSGEEAARRAQGRTPTTLRGPGVPTLEDPTLPGDSKGRWDTEPPAAVLAGPAVAAPTPIML